MPGILAQRYVAPALPRFLAAYPELSVRLTASDRLIDMVDEGVDVMLRIGELQDSALVGAAFSRTAMSAVPRPASLPAWQARRIRMTWTLPCLNFVYPKARQLRPWTFSKMASRSRSCRAAPWPWTMWIR
jgi:LysR family transcriptional regulator for bpeEF and oprC